MICSIPCPDLRPWLCGVDLRRMFRTFTPHFIRDVLWYEVNSESRLLVNEQESLAIITATIDSNLRPMVGRI